MARYDRAVPRSCHTKRWGARPHTEESAFGAAFSPDMERTPYEPILAGRFAAALGPSSAGAFPVMSVARSVSKVGCEVLA
jgi:hypothetical protein